MTATYPYDYKPAWRPVSAAHKHLGLSLNSIVYLNLIPIATRNDRILPGFAPAFARATRLQLQALQPDKVVVYGKGAFEALVRFAGNSWDVRYIEQRNFRMAPEVKRWLSA
ncbi:MAG TPA: hypothetical protein VMM76_18495 [Pirellulaceae bacterium]|nr:hypothetical protein [Pirellulaceae bacterium]